MPAHATWSGQRLVPGHNRKDIASLIGVGIDTVNEQITALHARVVATAVDFLRALSDRKGHAQKSGGVAPAALVQPMWR